MKKYQSAYELLGERFEKLVVIEILPVYISPGGKRTRKLKCKCDCGGFITTRLDTLKSGRSKSCGCISKQRLEEGRNKHGLHLHPLYKRWTTMKQRCYNPNNPEYPHYGARGVKVCDEWFNDVSSFIKWCLDNGWKKGLEIDKDIIPRKLNIPGLLYSPEMCSIVTPEINTNNRSITVFVEHNGEKLCISDWSKKTGIPRDRIHDRYTKGWSSEKILDPTNFGIATRLTGPKRKHKY